MSAGFYKHESDELYFAPNFVYHKDYELLKEHKDGYTYPVEGWYWFDTRELALDFFDIEDPEKPADPKE